MRKFVCVGVFAFLMAGCAQEYDNSALPVARASEQLGLDGCNSRARSGYISTATDLVNCYLPVERQAAVDARLKDMGLFDIYQSRLLLLAADVDAGRVPKDQFFVRYTALNQDFGASVNQIQANDRAQNAQTFQAIGAAGAALQGAASAYQAATPPPPLNCRTVYTGNVANTQCF